MYADRFESLAGRIKTVLVGMGNIGLMSEVRDMSSYGFCVYPIEMFVFSLPFTNSVSVSHYKNKETTANDIVVNQKVLRAVYDRLLKLAGSDTEIIELNKALKWNREQVTVLRGQLEWNRGQVTVLREQLEWNRGQIKTLKGQLEWNREKKEEKKKENDEIKAELKKYKSSIFVRIAWKLRSIIRKREKTE